MSSTRSTVFKISIGRLTDIISVGTSTTSNIWTPYHTFYKYC